jgi:repressor LexA
MLARWMSGTKRPGVQNLKVIASVFPEVYEIMGLSIDAANPGVSIPLLGRIAAGTAISMPHSDFSLYEPESCITIMRSWLPNNIDPSKLFALEVEGDSMIGEGIHDRDMIVLRQVKTANNGDLVAVRLDDDNAVTLKKFYRQNGTVRLQPANPEMEPILVNADQVHIEGKIVISIRKWF